MSVSAKAGSQTDARCYLAVLLTRPAQCTVDGEATSLRLVGDEHNLYQRNYAEIDWSDEPTGDRETWTHEVTLWDKYHGIEINKSVRIEVRSRETEGGVGILEGTVTEVAEHEVYLSGSELFDIKKEDHN